MLGNQCNVEWYSKSLVHRYTHSPSWVHASAVADSSSYDPPPVSNELIPSKIYKSSDEDCIVLPITPTAAVSRSLRGVPRGLTCARWAFATSLPPSTSKKRTTKDPPMLITIFLLIHSLNNDKVRVFYDVSPSAGRRGSANTKTYNAQINAKIGNWELKYG